MGKETSTENQIKKLDTWSLPNTVQKPDGYDQKTLPEATANNMLIFMDKINELTDAVNSLLQDREKLK